MDLHVFFVFCVCFCFDYVYFGSSSLYKNRSLFSFVLLVLFCFLCKLQSIHFIDISKFIPELSLQRTFLVSKKLSLLYFTFRTKLFLFFFYISHKIVFTF